MNAESDTPVQRCKVCGKWFKITTKLIKRMSDLGYSLPTRCFECNQLKNETRRLICNICGQPFIFSRLDETHLRAKYGDKYREPRNCPSCRAIGRLLYKLKKSV